MEALEKLKVSEGDFVYLTETPDGYSISPYDADFEKQMNVMRRVKKQYRNTLRELAK